MPHTTENELHLPRWTCHVGSVFKPTNHRIPNEPPFVRLEREIKTAVPITQCQRSQISTHRSGWCCFPCALCSDRTRQARCVVARSLEISARVGSRKRETQDGWLVGRDRSELDCGFSSCSSSPRCVNVIGQQDVPARDWAGRACACNRGSSWIVPNRGVFINSRSPIEGLFCRTRPRHQQ